LIHDLPSSFAIEGYPFHLAESQSARFSLGGMKVLVFGNSGCGKSTYARALAAREGIPHLDLDVIVWEPGQIAVQRSPASAEGSLRSFIDLHPAWVIEGCYGELVRAASTHCTQLVFLNPGMDACLANNLKRPWEPHKYASLELQKTMLSQLQEWVADYYQRKDAWSYQVHREIFDAFAGPKVEHRELGAYMEMR
jgi:adenylate kinase family enzyme